MIAIGLGIWLGGMAGFLIGLVHAITSRDGIWPDAWVIMIGAGALVGGIIGGIITVLT